MLFLSCLLCFSYYVYGEFSPKIIPLFESLLRVVWVLKMRFYFRLAFGSNNKSIKPESLSQISASQIRICKFQAFILK